MTNNNYNASYYHFGQANTSQWSLTHQYRPPDNPSLLTSTSAGSATASEPVLVSASVKIICPSEKFSEHKVFMLKDVNLSDIVSISSLREKIYTQFGSKFINNESEFDIGYFNGTKRIWMRDNDDLKYMIELMQVKTIMLWCIGRKKRSKKVSDSSDSEELRPKTKKKKRSACEERVDRVDDIVDELRVKHKTMFTNLQYRVWAETIVGGRHVSLTNPPKGSFFKKPIHSPERTMENSSAPITPVRAADLKSTYIKQIKELHSLVDIGAITQADFQKQKQVILDQMDKL